MKLYLTHKIPILVFLAALICCFQNCSPYHARTSSSVTAASQGPLPKTGQKTVILANGHVGRTVMSCDDGETWINDQSDNDATRCWVTGDPNYLECDHQPTSAHGVDNGDGWFFANFGWGYAGQVRKTRDGLNWTVMKNDGWGGGVAYVRSSLALFWGYWFTSDNLGATWTAVASSPAGTLDHAHLRRDGDLLFAFANNGMYLSRDSGKTWQSPPTYNPDWGGSGMAAHGNGVIVTVGYKFPAVNTDPYIGYAARSTDNGVTWSGQQMYSAQGTVWDGIVFNGLEFMAWSSSKVYRSTDGVVWTSAPVTSPVRFAGPITFNAETGTYIAIPNVWGNYYDAQRVLRSPDGVTWTEVDAKNFKGGHPILDMTIGKMDASACP